MMSFLEPSKQTTAKFWRWNMLIFRYLLPCLFGLLDEDLYTSISTSFLDKLLPIKRNFGHCPVLCRYVGFNVEEARKVESTASRC
jgi:hypothetical protein